ncbi:MAG: PKD domain-containing protein [Armatimonadetes bacterium]|nr:PKD domain-containing protein [Armatimonadota bacterium]
MKSVDSLRLLLGLGLACLATLPAAAVTPLNLLPGDEVIGQVSSDQDAPAVASGDGKVLAVWQDNRSNPYGTYEYETSYDIYGMLFDANGAPLSATPIPIAVAQGSQKRPRVAWNGTNFLVVFQSTGLGGTGYYYQDGLAAVRVTPTGQVLDKNPIQLYGLGSSSGAQWDVASDGNSWVVACEGTSASNGIAVVRISASGVVLDPSNKIVVQPTYYLRFNLKLAFAGGVFMLAFDERFSGGVDGTGYVRFDPALRLLDPVPVKLVDFSSNSLISNGSQFYLTAVKQYADFTVHVVGTRVTPTGLKLDGDGVDISANFEPQAYWGVYTAWTGNEYRVTWGSNNSLRMATVNNNGTVFNPGGVLVSGPQSGPIATTGDGGLQTAWMAYAGIDNNIFGAHILPSGATGPTLDLSVGAPMQHKSDIATDGNGWMVVYRSATATASRVMAMPLDSNGQPVLNQPVMLDTGPVINGLTFPNVTWTGTSYMVAWGRSPTSVVAQRIRPDGSKIDANPFVVMTGYFGPSDLCAIGDTVLVLGRRAFQNGQTITVFGTRVRASDGAVLDATPLTLGGGYVARTPAVAAVGGRFLAAFITNATHDNSMASTVAVFVPISGSPGASFSIHGPFSTAGGNGIFDVGLASNGATAIMVQPQELTSGVENDLLCRFIDANGVVSPYRNLTPWDGNQYRPRVAWDGRTFVIAYQEQKNRRTYWTLDQIDARSDLFAMRVLPDGTIIDPQGLMVSASDESETDPTVESKSNGVSMFAGSVMTNTANLTNYRVGTMVFGSVPNQFPVAVATATPNDGFVPLNVAFSSAGSYDRDGVIASYRWDFGDGWTSTEANPNHLFTIGLPVTVVLTVTDNAGAQTRQAILVWARNKNKLPVAIGVAEPGLGFAPLDVVFGADKSFDLDGFIGNIQWTFGDDQGTYWGGTAYHTFTSGGIWPVDLTVWDSFQATGTNRLFVVVGPSESVAPSQVVTSLGVYRGGNAASLATSDDEAYEIQEGIALSQGGPTAQFDAAYQLRQADPRGFVIRLEAAVTAVPAENVRQRVSALNRQTGLWEALDERACTGYDFPYEVAVTSGASRYVDPATKEVKLRVSWTRAGLVAFRGWVTKTDQLRLTVLYP